MNLHAIISTSVHTFILRTHEVHNHHCRRCHRGWKSLRDLHSNRHPATPDTTTATTISVPQKLGFYVSKLLDGKCTRAMWLLVQLIDRRSGSGCGLDGWMALKVRHKWTNSINCCLSSYWHYYYHSHARSSSLSRHCCTTFGLIKSLIKRNNYIQLKIVLLNFNIQILPSDNRSKLKSPLVLVVH